MLKLEFLVSLGLLITIFLIFFIADMFLMLPDVGDEEEVLEDAPLHPGEVVPDGIFLPSGSCCTRRVSPCSCWPRLLHGSTLGCNGCPGVSVVVVDVDGGDNGACTAGCWLDPVPDLLPPTEIEHDGYDA